MKIEKALDPTIIKSGAIGNMIDLGVDLKAPAILIKKHEVYEDKNSRLIFLLRNYRECIFRNMVPCTTERLQNGSQHYIRCLKFFDEFDGDKLLVYYEDLIVTPRPQLIEIAKFLNVNSYSEFFKNFDQHRRNSIKIYPGKSQTGGSLDFNFHTKKRRASLIKIIEDNIRKSNLYDRYLVRYSKI